MIIPLSDQIDCVERELGFRRRVYERQVAAGKMTLRTADLEIARMEAVLETLREVASTRAPDESDVQGRLLL